MKILRNALFAAVFVVSTGFFVGCGGVSEAEMQELRTLREEVSSMETEVNSLRDERTRLEREIQDKTARFQQCEKDKAEVESNLAKLPK